MPDNFSFKNTKGVRYYLNSKVVSLRGGMKQTIYYFTKDVRNTACYLPAGFEVVENPRNGFVILRRVK